MPVAISKLSGMGSAARRAKKAMEGFANQFGVRTIMAQYRTETKNGGADMPRRFLLVRNA